MFGVSGGPDAKIGFNRILPLRPIGAGKVDTLIELLNLLDQLVRVRITPFTGLPLRLPIGWVSSEREDIANAKVVMVH